MACVSALAAFPQGNAPITGIVVDEKGEPLIGVTVKLDGSMLGATTDLDGKFSLTIPADKKGKITLSYVGYPLCRRRSRCQSIDPEDGTCRKRH